MDAEKEADDDTSKAEEIESKEDEMKDATAVDSVKVEGIIAPRTY